MTSRSRPPRRDRAARRSATPGWVIPLLGAAVIGLAAVLAVVLTGNPGATPGSTVPPSAASTVPPSIDASAPAGETTGPTTSGGVVPPTITGEALPAFQTPIGDPAIGRPAPVVEGADFDGQPTAIADDGRPKVVLFLAHWCSHCQDEVPVIQAWVDAGGVPEGVDVISVVTAIDPGQPNHPPDAWLAREGWTVPVIVDPDNAVATAYGLAAFPFWAFIGPDGTIQARAAGELDPQQLEAVIGGLTGS